MSKKNTKNHNPHFGRKMFALSGYAASNGIEAILVGYMSFYLTDSVFMAAGVVGTILAVSRVFDGISDIIAGFIIDKTNTRWGKARPYTFFTIVMWVAAVLLFSVPDLSDFGKIVYVFIMYNLADTVGRTMLFAAEGVHMKRALTEDEIIDSSGICGLIAGVGSTIVTIAMPLLISNLGQTKEGWTTIALVFAIPCTILSLLKFFFMPEINEEEYLESKKANKITMKESVTALLQNKYILIFGAVLLLTQIYMGLSMGTYYFKYIVGDLELLSLISAGSLVSMVLMPFIPVLTRKMGLRNFAALFLLLGGIASFAVYLAPKNVGLLLFATAMLTLSYLPISMLMNLVAMQCMKYTEWHNGIQIEGLISSINGVSQKIGRAFGALFAGFMLSLSGYDGSLAVQSASAEAMIKFLYIAVPGIVMILAAIIMRKYTLEKDIPMIDEELNKRKNAKA